MIQTFRCKDTAKLFGVRGVTRWANFASAAERKRQMLNRATRLEDLRVPPNNRFDPFGGDRAGQFSIRINDQWRLCFRFDQGNAWDVEIVDDH